MKKLVGVFAAMALLGSGAALANDDKTKPQQDTAAQGGSGTSGSMGSTQSGSMQQDSSVGGSGMATSPSMGTNAMGQKELSGKVVRAESTKVYVKDAQGAVVTLDIDKSTTFTDPTLKKAKDLKEGQEIGPASR